MKNVIGHLGVQNQLNALFESGLLPHAILLHGPKGVGKRLLAELFARRLLCGPAAGGLIAPEGLSYDEHHELYPQIEAESTPDYLVIEPEDGKKSISVENVRNTLKSLSLSSDGKRVVIIDAADEMNSNSANALLKTLEEPGQGVHIILLAHNMSKLLPTIVSRCRQFRVNKLKDSELEQVLNVELEASSAVEIDKLVELAAGCPGEALRLGEVGTDLLEMIDGYMNQKGVLRAVNLAEKIQQKKLSPMALELLLTRIAQKAKTSPNAHDWASLYQKIDQKRKNMDVFNLNPQLVLETSLMDVISLNQ